MATADQIFAPKDTPSTPESTRPSDKEILKEFFDLQVEEYKNNPNQILSYLRAEANRGKRYTDLDIQYMKNVPDEIKSMGYGKIVSITSNKDFITTITEGPLTNCKVSFVWIKHVGTDAMWTWLQVFLPILFTSMDSWT